MDINLLLEPRGSESPDSYADSESPGSYSDSESTRSQTPDGSFYHGASSADPARPRRSTSPAYSRPPLNYTPAIPNYTPAIPNYTPTTPIPEFTDPVISGHNLVNFGKRGREEDSEVDVRREARRKENEEAMEESRATLAQSLTWSTEPYCYSPLSPTEIRLLRITPGRVDTPMFLSLKIFPLDKVHTELLEFQALSYAWGKNTFEYDVQLSDLPRAGETSNQAGTRVAKKTPPKFRAFSIRQNLYNALQRIRLTDNYSWIWVDAICIDQFNDIEKNQQIPKMPEIYSSAYNVIAWLGEGGSGIDDVGKAIDLIPHILNLKTLDLMLRGHLINQQEALEHWLSFGLLLQRSWFGRRWVIQEVACARRLCIRVGAHILSWQDFADAVDLYSKNINRIRALMSQTAPKQLIAAEPSYAEDSRAVALMDISRNVFRKEPDTGVKSRLMTLEALVSTASPFAVTDLRDIVFALLYLANDRDDAIVSQISAVTQHAFGANYSEHPVEIFTAFVRYCLERSRCLDIIYRAWAMWPTSQRDIPYQKRTLPSWIGVAVYAKDTAEEQLIPTDSLVGTIQQSIYNASKGISMNAMVSKSVLQADGVVINLVHVTSDCIKDGILEDHCLRVLGWRGSLANDVDVKLWRTLVANRSLNGEKAPAWYRRAAALALTLLDNHGNLDIPTLSAKSDQPSTVAEYLKRLQEATDGRRIFRSVRSSLDWAGMRGEMADASVGLGPHDLQRYDMVCILFGCSVPVVLRQRSHQSQSKTSDLDRTTNNVTLVGPCYVDGFMEGEKFARDRIEELSRRKVSFRIH